MLNRRHFNNKLALRYARVWNGKNWVILDKQEGGIWSGLERVPDLRIPEISIEESNKLRSGLLEPIFLYAERNENE